MQRATGFKGLGVRGLRIWVEGFGGSGLGGWDLEGVEVYQSPLNIGVYIHSIGALGENARANENPVLRLNPLRTLS